MTASGTDARTQIGTAYEPPGTGCADPSATHRHGPGQHPRRARGSRCRRAVDHHGLPVRHGAARCGQRRRRDPGRPRGPRRRRPRQSRGAAARLAPGVRDTDNDGRPDGEEDPDADGRRHSRSWRAGRTPWTRTRTTTARLTAARPCQRRPRRFCRAPRAAPSSRPATSGTSAIDDRPVAAGQRDAHRVHRARRGRSTWTSARTPGTGSRTRSWTGRRRVSRSAFDYADESDAGRVPDPGRAAHRGRLGPAHPDGRRDNCRLYELYAVRQTRRRDLARGLGRASGTWAPTPCGRPAGPAPTPPGLPILPGLVRYDEVAGGAILHALRLHGPRRRARRTSTRRATSRRDLTGAALPADGPARPAEGRCDMSRASPPVTGDRRALQRYGMILADNGSPWYVSGMRRPAAGTTTSSMSLTASPAQTWRSLTRPGWSTARSPDMNRRAMLGHRPP